MVSHLRRRRLELVGTILFVTFLFNGVFYSLCAYYRPRMPWPAKGWTFPVTTKFGTCYTSAFESLAQRCSIWIWIPVFLIAFVLQFTYTEGWNSGQNIGQNLRKQRAR
jgi:hypothetical protein